MKTNLLKFLFKIFSFLADKTNGAKVFVKPKLFLGTLILGIGVTACTNSAKSPTQQPTCYEPAIAPDTVEAMAECYKPAIDTVNKQKLTPPPEIPVSCYEQVDVSCYLTIEIPADTVYDENKIYEVVEQMPEFIGGEAALFKFISENLKNPDPESCIQGKVIVRFVIEKDGSVSNPEIMRSLDPAFDREALRIVHIMPKWKAGTSNGKAVRCYFTIPVMFRLQ